VRRHGRFMDGAPQAQLVASALSAGFNLARFPWRYRVLDVCDGDTIELGRGHSLRVLETPQPVRSLLDGITPLEPAWTHAMRGGSILRDGRSPFLNALRERPWEGQSSAGFTRLCT
jgi:hypothetical protein